MTHGAGGGESRRDVIWLCGCDVFGLVAGVAICRRRCKVAGGVATCAGYGDVRTGQGKGRLVVIENRAGPRGGVVTSCASGGKPSRDVIRLCGCSVVRLMAGVAVCRRRSKVVIGVALRAS